MDTSSAESRRQAIDDEINSLEELQSIRALKSRRNALAPISRLPPEILAKIFFLLSSSAWNDRDEAGHLAWICVAHICRRWRETALDHPCLWSHISFTKLTPSAVAEILARAKMTPLHLEANVAEWSEEWFDAFQRQFEANVTVNVAGWEARFDTFERQLEAHISHTCHLSITGLLHTVIQRLVSSAPTLEFLSLSHNFSSYLLPQIVLPINIFNCNTPSLTNVQLERCDVSWNSPLLKGLRTLKILRPSREARPKLEDWLDALNEMPQLETLHLESATPLSPQATLLKSEPSRTITLPSLTGFHITASARDCGLALAHLMLPTLTRLMVCPKSLDREGEDVQLLIPYVARNVYEMHDTKPLRSILISGERSRAEVVAWTTPDADVKVCDPGTLLSASVSACLVLSATGRYWNYRVDTAIFDVLLKLLPMDSVSTFTAQNHTQPVKEFWLSHVPRWPLLEQARLVPNAVMAFRDMLEEDAPPDGPLLPSLTKLIIINVTLDAFRTSSMLDMLIERVEQGVPLEVLDLRTCVASNREIQLFKEIVVDVQKPLAMRPMMVEEPTVFKWYNLRGMFVSYHDGRGPWYGDAVEVDDEAEYGYNDVLLDSDDEDDYDVV